MGGQACDMGDSVRSQLLCQFPALLRSSGIGIEHGRGQGASLLIRKDEGFSEAGDADPGHVRILIQHFPDHFVYPVHDSGYVHLVAAHRPLYRIVPVCLAEIGSVLTEHCQLAAGGSDIQSSDLHASSFSRNLTWSSVRGSLAARRLSFSRAGFMELTMAKTFIEWLKI